MSTPKVIANLFSIKHLLELNKTSKIYSEDDIIAKLDEIEKQVEQIQKDILAGLSMNLSEKERHDKLEKALGLK